MSSASEGPRSKEQVQEPAPGLAGRLAEECTDTADGAFRDSIRDSIHDSVHDSVHDSILDSVTEPTQEDHQDLGDQQQLGTEDVNSVSSAVAEEVNKHEDEVQTSTCEETAIWRPAWLQPSILASFAGLFLAFGIILPISLCLSKSNYGLFETRQGLGYLWRFGPIAVLTVISALWARVDLQTLRYAPWIVARSGQNFEPDLDYTAMIAPTILIQSFRRRHIMVFSISLVTLMLKAEILLAAGLLSISPTETKQPVAINVLDTFNSTYDAYSWEPGANDAYFSALAMRDFEMAYPYGVDKGVAYQTFTLSRTKTRGTVRGPVTAKVDGFFCKTECLLLESSSVENLIIIPQGIVGRNLVPMFNLTIGLRFEGCGKTVRLQSIFPVPERRFRQWSLNDTLYPDKRPCSNLPPGDEQFVYFVGNWGPWNLDSSTPPRLGTTSAVLCSASSWTSKVEVVDDGIHPLVNLLSDQPKIPQEASIWDRFILSRPDDAKELSKRGSGTVAQDRVFGPLAVDLLSNYQNMTTITSETLRDSVVDLSGLLGPLIAHHSMRTGSEDSTSGEISMVVDRLFVNVRICVSMSVIFISVVLIMIYVIFQHGRHTKLWCRDPATIMGLFLYSRTNRGLARPHPDPVNELWVDNTFLPVVLRTWTQGIYTLFVCGLVVSVSVTLHLSQLGNGLTTVSQNEYSRLLWTNLPTIMVFGVVLHTNSCDAAWRGLSTLLGLSKASQNSEQIDQSMLDMFGPWALWRSYHQKVWTVSLSQTMVLACGFLTALTAVLFSVHPGSKPMPVQLQRNSWFGDRLWGNNSNTLEAYQQHRETIAILLAQKGEINYTYPKNTFEDLVFPAVDETGLDRNTFRPEAGGRMSVNAMIPTAKLMPTCEKMPKDFIRVTMDGPRRVGGRDENGDLIDHLNFIISMGFDVPCPNGSIVNVPVNITTESAETLSPFKVGVVLPSPQNLVSINYQCQLGINETSEINSLFTSQLTQTYLWGSWNNDNTTLQIVCWRCNYSWAQINTEVNLLWSDGKLLIDKNKPPQPDYASKKPWSPSFVVPHLDVSYGEHPYPLRAIFPAPTHGFTDKGYFDIIFNRIIEPYGKFSRNTFGDQSSENEILEALHYDLAFTSAQLANIENRLVVGDASSNYSSRPDDLAPIEARVVDNDKRHLIQDPISSAILISILGFVILSHFCILLTKASRHLGLRVISLTDVRGLAPKGYSSPAMMVALLEGSNAMKYIPVDAHKLQPNELHKMMEGVRFRMGWFMRESDQTLHYTIGVLDDEDVTFMGSKAEMAAMDRHRAKAD